jgi:hypothetical protein
MIPTRLTFEKKILPEKRLEEFFRSIYQNVLPEN